VGLAVKFLATSLKNRRYRPRDQRSLATAFTLRLKAAGSYVTRAFVADSGEAAALRWRHYDPTVTPLGKILVAKSYNTRGNIEKTTKTDAVKHIHVHPVLAAMLAQWRVGGWPEMMGVRRGRMT
jgi:hypothetical protein